MNIPNPAATGKIIYGCVMALIYIGLGTMLMVRPDVLGPYRDYAYMLGGVAVLYGAFRGYRAWLDLEASKRDQQRRQS